jgi:hypothetical protein
MRVKRIWPSGLLGDRRYCVTNVDVIYDQDRVECKVYQAAYDTWTNAILESTQSAMLTLVVTVTADLGALAMIYVSKNKVLEFIAEQGDFWIYACLILFAIGFFGAFAAIRLLPRSIKQFFFSATIWLISIGVGLANVALFYSLLVFNLQ